jgi:hypothetical protein
MGLAGSPSPDRYATPFGGKEQVDIKSGAGTLGQLTESWPREQASRVGWPGRPGQVGGFMHPLTDWAR